MCNKSDRCVLAVQATCSVRCPNHTVRCVCERDSHLPCHVLQPRPSHTPLIALNPRPFDFWHPHGSQQARVCLSPWLVNLVSSQLACCISSSSHPSKLACCNSSSSHPSLFAASHLACSISSSPHPPAATSASLFDVNVLHLRTTRSLVTASRLSYGWVSGFGFRV